VDLVLINRLAGEISGDKRERAAMKRAHRRQAEVLLERNWKAVEELALALLEQGWLSGREAHQLLRQELRETDPDWRLQWAPT